MWRDNFKQKKDNWDNLSNTLKYGRCIVRVSEDDNDDSGAVYLGKKKWIVDNNIPVFTEDRNYIEKYLAVEEA